jgi:pimeloyl-ACP methyl ester carboxylesterase
MNDTTCTLSWEHMKPLASIQRAVVTAMVAIIIPALLPAETTRAQDPAYPPPTWEPADCWFDTAAIDAGAIRCGYVAVPENRAKPDGRVIRLAVAVADPVSPDAPSRPAVLLHGGPGIASLTRGRGIPLLRRWVGDRRVVIFDVRGVGETGPIMCPALRITESDIAAMDLTLDEANALERGAYLACRDEILNQGKDLAGYNSAAIAKDLRDIRKALGYSEWDLVGGSAGAWVVRNALREDPEGVRTATLMGGSGEATGQLFHEVPFTARAFAYVFAGCETDPDCSSRYPGLEEMFYRTYEELARNPWTVAIDPSQFRQAAFTINAQDYVRAIYRLLGDREMMHIPAVVAAFHSRDEDVVRRIIEREYGGLSSTFSSGMATAVVCYDFHSPQYAAEYREAAAPYPSALSDIRDWLANCPDFLAARASAEERRLVRSEIPTLIITGERDAMNPPETWADHDRLLPNGFHFTFPGAGHGFILFNPLYQPCLNQLITQFLAAPSRRPDDACIAALPEREISAELPDWAKGDR